MDLLAAAVRGESPSALLERTRQAAAEVCPYRGLEVFREEDAPFFFGREAFTEELPRGGSGRSRWSRSSGAPGSGKSSVVRAGLVPSLRRPDGEHRVGDGDPGPGRSSRCRPSAGALLPLLEPEMTEIDRLVEVNKQAGHLRSRRSASSPGDRAGDPQATGHRPPAAGRRSVGGALHLRQGRGGQSSASTASSTSCSAATGDAHR